MKRGKGIILKDILSIFGNDIHDYWSKLLQQQITHSCIYRYWFLLFKISRDFYPDLKLKIMGKYKRILRIRKWVIRQNVCDRDVTRGSLVPF